MLIIMSRNITWLVPQVTEERLKKMWITVDAQTNQKDDIKRETVYCLDDDNETEVQKDDTIQGEEVFFFSLHQCAYYCYRCDFSTCTEKTLHI